MFVMGDERRKKQAGIQKIVYILKKIGHKIDYSAWEKINLISPLFKLFLNLLK